MTGQPRRLARLLVPIVGLAASVVTMMAAEAPRARLRIVGGVGYRQFMRVGLWLADNLAAGPDAPDVWFGHHITGHRFRDSILMLQNGEAELALVNARSVAAMAVRGRGMFDRPVTNMRAIAALPHYDWALFAIDKSLGVQSFADVKAKRVPITLATGFTDGDSAVAFIAEQILRRHGVTFEDVRAWGGRILPGGPGENRADMGAGRASVVCQEGARGEEWEQLARERPLTFLSAEKEAAEAITAATGFGFLEVPAGYYPGQDRPFLAADFSDWLICVRDDMPDALAYRLAQIVIERRDGLEREYRAENPRYSSVNLPLEPRKLATTTPVPLHPGAARYYKEHGLVD
jgi:TRAP transporter TAXI family solute receptor